MDRSRGADRGSYDLKGEKETQLKQDSSKESTYTATVEDVHSTSQTMGVQLSEGEDSADISLKGGLKNTAGNRATFSTTMSITYHQSNAVTEDRSIVIEGKLDHAKTSHLADVLLR